MEREIFSLARAYIYEDRADISGARERGEADGITCPALECRADDPREKRRGVGGRGELLEDSYDAVGSCVRPSRIDFTIGCV